MKIFRRVGISLVLVLSVSGVLAFAERDQAKNVPVEDILKELVNRASLTGPGSVPFYLRASVLNKKQPDWEYNAKIEEYWVSPIKWRRIIQSKGFSQVLIVNGDQRSEQNTGDFFPPEVEQLALSLVEPIPANVVDAFAKLSMEIQQPNGQPGQCFTDDYFNDDRGERVRAAVAVDSKTGLLNYLWYPSWSVGVFADYRSFHGKMIAWKTIDNDVNANIEDLRELKRPDEALFAIKESTPAADRIRTVLVNGGEYQKLINTPPDAKGAMPPASGTVKVMIVTDRAGSVREAVSYVASNGDLKKWVVDQAKGWKFTPYLEDGVPAQVESTLSLDFKTDVKPEAASLPLATSNFDKARGLSALRTEGGGAFHLTASFEAFGNVELTGKGAYEEIWVSPKQWRRQGTLGRHTVIETRNGDLQYRKVDQEYSPRRIDEAMEAIAIGLPGDGGTYSGPEWRVGPGKLGGMELVQVWRGRVDDDGKPQTNARVYYFDSKSGLLRARYEMGQFALYNDFQEFSRKEIARRVTLIQDNSKTVEISIERLEAATTQSTETFTLPGIEPISYGGGDAGTRMVQPRLIKQVKPAYPAGGAGHPAVACHVLVDQYGHVREVTFLEHADPAFENAARAAVMQWEYIPATTNGRPVTFPSEVRIQF
jgi:outer membrane biosynthesis protein TonB